MSIDWKAVQIIECDLKALTVTIKTAEGYPIAVSTYETKEVVIYNASKCFKMQLKAKKY